jgi:hypothetical protein
LPYYATATQRHADVATFHTKPTSRRIPDKVFTGKNTVDDSKDAPQVMLIRSVDVIEIHNFCPLVGVPDKLVVNEVISLP